MDKASEAILALKPVTFHYKSDKTNRPEFGLIAEDVARSESGPGSARHENGEIYTVRYEAVNAMLLNEFLKEHARRVAGTTGATMLHGQQQANRSTYCGSTERERRTLEYNYSHRKRF